MIVPVVFDFVGAKQCYFVIDLLVGCCMLVKRGWVHRKMKRKRGRIVNKLYHRSHIPKKMIIDKTSHEQPGSTRENKKQGQ